LQLVQKGSDQADINAQGRAIMNIIKAALLNLLLAATFGVSYTACAKEVSIATLEHNTPQVNAAVIVMTEIYKRIGYDMTIVRFPGKRSLVEANLGTTNGELLRIQSIESHYPNLVRVPYAIGRLSAFAVVHKGQPMVTDLSGLVGKRVGILRGVEYTEILTRNLDRQILNSIDSLFQILLNGRVDVILFPERDARKYIKIHGLENEIDMGEKAIINIPLYHFLHKDSHAIADELAEEIKRMTKSGALEKLIEETDQSQN
jgi:polar amino acid transport system substrate-binding protein